MGFLGWISKKTMKKERKEKTVENVALDEAGTGAFDRRSDAPTADKTPASTSPATSLSPATRRRRIKRTFRKKDAFCDVIDASDGANMVQVFEGRGYDMSLPKEKKQVLGEGGFGKVILIRGGLRQRGTLEEEESGMREEARVFYACKTIDAREKFDKRLRELGNELRGLSAGHSHPHIIQLFDAFIVHSKFCIIMEYADCVSSHAFERKAESDVCSSGR